MVGKEAFGLHLLKEYFVLCKFVPPITLDIVLKYPEPSHSRSLFSHVLSVHPSFRPSFQLSHKNKTNFKSSENSDRYWRDCGSGRVDH